MATVTAPESTLLHLRLKLPESVVEQYESQARSAGKTFEQFIADKLIDSAEYTSTRPLYVTDAQRREFEILLKRNFGSVESLLGAVKKLCQIKVGDTSISLDATLIERMRSRCPRNEPFERFLTKIATMLLEQFVGMR